MELMDPTVAPERDELLVLRTLKLGDLLVAVPAIRGLRRAFPDHRLVLAAPGWLAPIAGLVGGVFGGASSSGIDALLPTPGLDELLPLHPGRVDIAVNLHGRGPESSRLIEALEPRLRIEHAAPGPEWVDGILERERWVRLVNGYGIDAHADDVALEVPDFAPALRNAAVVHVGAFYGSRRWPVERFAAVARALTEAGHAVVFTGSDAERPRALAVAEAAGLGDATVLAGRLRLDEFAAVVAAATVVISADTGAAHLASAYGTRSVVLFGPAPPEEWGPPATGRHIVLTDASRRVGDTFGSEPDPALLAVSVDDVLTAVGQLLR